MKGATQKARRTLDSADATKVVTMDNENNTRQALTIVGGGAVGGGLSWLFTIAGGGHLGNLSTLPAILTSIVLGAGAGFIGVYVVANSDRRDLVRCLAFAVLCGFAWRVVYEGGESMLSKRQFGSEAAAGSARTESLAQEVTTNTAAPTQAKVVALAAASSDSLNAASKAGDPQAKEKAAQASAKALDALATTTQPEAAESVAHIATAAVLNDQPALALRAVNNLKSGPPTAAKTKALLQIESIARQKNVIAVTQAARAKQ